MRSTPSEVCGHVCVGVIELITPRAREMKPCRSVAVLVATLHAERRAEGSVREGHGLELSWRQELFGCHDRREPRARGRPPNRSGQRQRVPDGATLHAREEHAQLTYAGGGSSVTATLRKRTYRLCRGRGRCFPSLPSSFRRGHSPLSLTLGSSSISFSEGIFHAKHGKPWLVQGNAASVGAKQVGSPLRL